MKRKKSGSLFAGLLVFVLLLLVACTVAVNLIFSGDRVPRVAGYYLYMQDSDEMELSGNPAASIPGESLVAAEAAVISELHEGNKVLCYLADGTLALRNIYKIEELEDGTVNYYPGTAKEQGTDLVIPRTNIFAVCVWSSPELYWYIKFATSVNGLMAFLVAPCVLLIVMLLVHIARNGTDDMEDEEFEQEELPAEKPKKKLQPAAVQNPLYEPESGKEALPEEKKSSISENFSAKPVSEESPYQKAEREKTARMRRQELEEEALRALEAPRPKKEAVSSSTQVYSAEQVREQARIQAQQKMAEQTAASTQPFPAQPPEAPAPQPEPAPPKPEPSKPEPSKPEPSKPEPSKPEPPKPEAPKSAPVPAAKPAYSSPNIDDILKAGKKSNSAVASSESIDDLIRLLENEKNKL